MQSINSRVKILAVIDECENGIEAAKSIERVVRSWKNPEVYLLYTVDLSHLSSVVLASLDKKFYDGLRAKGAKVLEAVTSELRRAGIDSKVAGMYFGFAEEGILRYEKMIRPDAIVIHEKQQAVQVGSLAASVIARAKAPVLITKDAHPKVKRLLKATS